MANPSGTVATTTIEVADILDSAAGRCGIQQSQMTPEIVATLLRNLHLILSRIPARGAALWAVTREILPLRTDQVSYQLAAGTTAIHNANYCVPEQLSYGGNPTATFLTATPVSCVGLLPGVTSTATLDFQVSDDGLTWTSVETPGATSLVDGAWLWYEIDPAPAALQFRVVATTGSFTLETLFLANAVTEVSMYQMNRDDYAGLSNFRSSGQPSQFLFDRQYAPLMHVYPMPSTAEAFIRYWRQRVPQDVGDLTCRLDLPVVWTDAVIYRLAAQSLLEIPGADVTRLDPLLKLSTEFWNEAADDETDRGPRIMHPDISGYTR